MRRFGRRGRIAVLGAAAAVFLGIGTAGCGKTASMLTRETAIEEYTFKVGGIVPLSGAVAEYGTSVKMGAQLAAEEINASGGINGYAVSLEFLDDAHEEETARQAYGRLKERGMQILLGTLTSAPCRAVSELAAKDGMFQMIPSAVGESCIQGEQTFRLCFSDGARGRKAAEFFSGQKTDAKTAVICDGEDEHFAAISRSFCERAQELGLQVTDEIFLERDLQPEALCRSLQERGVEQVFLAVYYPDAEPLLKSMEQSGYRPQILSCEEIDTLLSDTDFDWEYARHVVFQEPYPFFSEETKNLRFREHYEARYENGPPNQYAAEGYDAMYAVKEAAEKAKITPDMTCEEMGLKLQEAMEGLVLYGVMGQTVWEGSQEPQREMLLVRIEEGSLVPVEAGEKAGEETEDERTQTGLSIAVGHEEGREKSGQVCPAVGRQE